MNVLTFVEIEEMGRVRQAELAMLGTGRERERVAFLAERAAAAPSLRQRAAAALVALGLRIDPDAAREAAPVLPPHPDVVDARFYVPWTGS